MPQWDLTNADCIVVMGSNMAENHPIAFRFVMEAKRKGAAVIHADPRFTRTSAMADLHAPVRAGTDIAFLGGIIRYILENDCWFKEFALSYTNISTVIEPGFESPTEDSGYFSGWNPEQLTYNQDTWQYEGQTVPSALAEHYLATLENFNEKVRSFNNRPPTKDPTLQHPHCVYQLLKRHYAAYTPEMVERVTGCPKEAFLKVCEALTRNSGRDRTSAFAYAVGWTHHSVGVQIIRAAGIIQGLLGNVGRPGGGIIALRGHTSIQGSTDIPTLYNLMSGYLPQPHVSKPHSDLKSFMEAETSPTGWWHNFPKYYISLLKAWYGKAAVEQNDYCFDLVPKIVGDHSQLPMTLAMKDGIIKGLFLLGQNPVVGGSNSRLVQRALANLDWLVVRDFTETESASFWYEGDDVVEGRLRPQDIRTEIFLMPASIAGEKAGTFTNTHRLVQWHDKVVEAPGDSRSELWFMVHLGRRLKELYADSTLERDRPIHYLAWDYPLIGPKQDPDAEAVLREINGFTVADNKQIASFKELKDDGSTACGCWLYAGAFPDQDHNQTRSRVPDGPDGPGTHLGWGFAWPANRRTLYNRASADPEGKPWSERKRLVWWDEEQGKWVGPDEIDFQTDKPPGYEPDWDQNPTGMDALYGRDPFIMLPDGQIALFVPSGLKDGPLPSHYEPIESPVRNQFYPVDSNPAAKRWVRDDNPIHAPGDPRYPHMLTTYRLTEHHSGGTPTRSVSVLAELQPEGFCEISTELARDLGIRNLDWVVLSTPRGEVETRALVTDRMQPFRIDGRIIHQLGMPWHFGWKGYATGDIANVLTSVVADPNSSMHENKALSCALRRGRLERRT